MTASPDPVAARVLAALDAAGVIYEVVPCDPEFADTAAFCERYGVPLEHSANTILVASRTEPRRYAACVLLASTRLDVNHTVRRRLGVRRCSFADAEETRALTGMEVGGVTVAGLPPGVPLWVDARVFGQPWVIVGGGSRNLKVKLSPQELFKLGAESVEGLAVERSRG
ncbi:Cys-tRNA(Pro)/Cys-tRNA(Cys) deacylase YbaK [bacterium HR29]|mgnify:CR=1 FL=1|jgi:prolyl-tRNA editing enzyme YbaK/EbsC (Cys-tRNA(Pro) deacylase)|nr:Cys-tRNA(Pro)/Cys-tRNA(Cys) deacylase YbaK [bacterium HR29]